MRAGGVTVGVLLVLSLFAPTGVAAAEPATSATVADDVGSEELHVRTTFSIDGVGDDEIRVVRELHPGAGVDSVEQQVPESARDVSTRNMDRQGDTYSWDGTGDVARVSFVAEAADLTGPRGRRTDSGGQARRGDGFAVVESTYESVRTDAADVSTAVTVDGEGTAGESVAVLGPHETYSRESESGPVRLVVPAHANLTEAPGDVLDALVFADRRIDAGLDRNETGTYVAVESDLGGVLGLVSSVSFGEDRQVLDAYVNADASVDVWQHELIHERKQSYRTTDATRWTTEGNAQYYGYLMAWQNGEITFRAFRGWLRSGSSIHNDTRLDDPATWRGEERPVSQYVKGGILTAYLDAEIRRATDGERTYQDVLQRMNDHEGELTHEEFVEMVVAVGGQELEPAVERYTTTDAAPPLSLNPYTFTDPSIESDVRLREGSGLFSTRSTKGGLIYLTLEFANEGEETSSAIGLNTSLPDGWEILSVGTRVPPGPVEHADYGYLNLPPGSNESYSIAARVSDNASLGNHTLQFTAMDLSGEESTFNTTIEVISEEEAEAAEDAAEDEEAEPTAPPASALDVELGSAVDGASTGRENESSPVFSPGQTINGTVSVTNADTTIVDVTPTVVSARADTREVDGPSKFAVEPDSSGHQVLMLEVQFEDGTSRSTSREVVVNDVPSVDIWGGGLENAGETHKLEAEIENEYGSTTAVWYVNGEQVATGETYEHTYREAGDNVTVVVRDEYGATDRDSRQFRGMTGLEALLPRTIDPEAVTMLLGGAFGALVLLGALLVRRR